MSSLGSLRDVDYLILSTALTWVMLITAATLRSRAWSPAGVRTALGNRDDVPPPSPVAERADRAAKNMLENLVLFVAAFVAARAAGAQPNAILQGAAIFFFARLVYFFVYLAGIRYLRTLAWAVALVGVGLVGAAAVV